MEDNYDDVKAELTAQARLERIRRNRYLAHPNPADPDYPHEYESEEGDDD